MKVDEIMTADPVCCEPDDLVMDVAKRMCEEDCGALPVVDAADKPVGVLTDRDIVCRLVAEGRDVREATVAECMSDGPVTVLLGAPAEEAFRRLEEHQVRRVIVVDERGTCVGIVAQADVALRGGEREVAEVVREVSRQAPAGRRPLSV
jgi:CBS domain-containing protein